MLYGYVDVWMWNKLINIDIYGELAKPTDWASKNCFSFCSLFGMWILAGSCKFRPRFFPINVTKYPF